MPWIAHRRRGSEFGHHPFVIALVTPPLLPLALSMSSLWHSLVLTFSPKSTRALDPSEKSIGTDGHTAVPRRRLLLSFPCSESASILLSGPSLCL
jgi:hypothetical protein